MAGQRQVPPGMLSRVHSGRGRGLTVVEPARPKVPRLPIQTAHREVRAIWRNFWLSRVSWAVDLEADAERLLHWATMLDDRASLRARIRADGELVPWGPFGAQIRHPLFPRLAQVERELAHLADRFGLSPIARFRLQLQFAEAGLSASKLAKEREAPAPRPRAPVPEGFVIVKGGGDASG